MRDNSRNRSPPTKQTNFSHKPIGAGPSSKQPFVPALNVNVNINVAQSQTFNMDKLIWQATNSHSPRLPDMNPNRQLADSTLPQHGG